MNGKTSDAEKWKWLDDLLSGLEGSISCVYKNLVTGESYCYRENEVHPSASVIKIFLMAYVMQLACDGKLRLTDRIRLRREDMAESCGVLYYLKDVEEMSVRDLMELMIIVSDNAATNTLCSYVGMENLQRYLEQDLQLTATRYRRMMMDFEAARRGFQNNTSAAEVAAILEKIYRRELVSAKASELMLQVLKEQQFDDLIPACLNEFLPEHSIAHKSGGLDHVVHDAAIIDAGKEPFLLCFFGSSLEDRLPLSKAMGEAALRIYRSLQTDDESVSRPASV